MVEVKYTKKVGGRSRVRSYYGLGTKNDIDVIVTEAARDHETRNDMSIVTEKLSDAGIQSDMIDSDRNNLLC